MKRDNELPEWVFKVIDAYLSEHGNAQQISTLLEIASTHGSSAALSALCGSASLLGWPSLTFSGGQQTATAGPVDGPTRYFTGTPGTQVTGPYLIKFSFSDLSQAPNHSFKGFGILDRSSSFYTTTHNFSGISVLWGGYYNSMIVCLHEGANFQHISLNIPYSTNDIYAISQSSLSSTQWILTRNGVQIGAYTLNYTGDRYLTTFSDNNNQSGCGSIQINLLK